MYLYDVRVNGINVEIKASNMATAVRRAVDMAKKRYVRRIWIEASRLENALATRLTPARICYDTQKE